jgi:glycosyltransferase involved in cell wall biosynthesis
LKLLVINWQDRRNPQAGGAETHLHEIFGRIAGRGHEVTMLVSGWAGAPHREELDGIDVHRAGSRYTFSVAGPRYYRAHLAAARHDLVVEALNKVPLFAPGWSRSPVVLVVHHLFGATAFREAPLPLALATWLLEKPIPAVYRGVPVQAISESTAADLGRRGLDPGDITVVHPGVDLRFFSPGAARQRSPVPAFLYLGRLKRYKRVDLLLLASAALARSGVAHRVLIAGSGDHEPRLRKLADQLGIAATVDFLGFVTETRKRDLFREVWANIFTSPKEGWGITNVEAAACGTATIASDSPGLRESVVDGVTGLLVPHGDIAALADAMRALAIDPARVEQLGRGAMEFASSFSWDTAAAETLSHLERLAAAGAVATP